MQTVQEKPAVQVDDIRKEFPILHQEVNGYPLIYFDNAATSQKPQAVIDSLVGYYTKLNSNVHRGAHTLADLATRAFEETRTLLREFINAASEEEVIITKGTTEGINLIAYSWGRQNIHKGDEILITAMEHHANIVPWQMLCMEKGAHLKVVPLLPDGTIDMEVFAQLLTEKTKLVSVMHISNVLGTINPVEEIVQKAHAAGATVHIDGAQGAPHMPLDMQKIGADFYTFSSHKMFGPTGIGVLYGKKEVLEAMPPYLGGGEMIKEVDFEGTTFNELPFKFEAGTPNIGDTIALAEAIKFMNRIGRENMATYEEQLTRYAHEAMADIKGIQFIGTAPKKASVVSFLVEGLHPFDIGMMLDARGIAIRTGHHCAQPLMKHLGLDGTARASFAVYNTIQEIDTFAEALRKLAHKFAKV